MPYIAALFVFVFASASYANDYNFKCIATYNAEKVMENVITLQAGEKNKFIGEVDGDRFIISSLSKEKIELQIYNTDEPSRTYSTATISETQPLIGLSIWKRESILEIYCQAI
jgi:hypothetical protein